MVEPSESKKALFAPVPHSEWITSVTAALKGQRIADRLVSRSSDGIEIQPLYMDNGTGSVVPGQVVPGTVAPGNVLPGHVRRWSRRESLGPCSSAEALAKISRANSFGIDSFSCEPCAPDSQTAILGLAAQLDCEVHFTDWASAQVASERLGLGLAGSTPVRTKDLTSELIADWRQSKTRPLLQRASSSDEQEQGAGAQLQLALCLWRAARWLREATRQGLSLEEAGASLELEVSLGTDLYLEIAKLRALRMAYTKLLAACSHAQPIPCRIHAKTSARAWTVRDPWVNGLRGTTIAFAAAVGGADSIMIAPFDAMIGVPNEEALRLARNTHAILTSESHMAAVQDPAAGSGYVEALTGDLAHGAWGLFQHLEALDEESSAQHIAEEIQRCAEQEALAISTRRTGIIGVSEFPNLGEQLPERERAVGSSPATRLAAPFEELRSHSDAQLARTGKRPTAFLANMGTQSQFRARTDFASNLLAAGGIEVIENEGFDSVASALGANATSGADIAIIASTDALYDDCVPELARGLKGQGSCVVLAGKPGASENSWRAAGVDHFMHLGCDAIALLSALQNAAEVSA